jgi:Flavodoxin
MSRVLIASVSHYGQTALIAQRIADVLRTEGHIASLVNTPKMLEKELGDAWDAVVIGSPIRIGRHDAGLQRVASAHVDRLNALPSAFFSVSLSASREGRTLRDAERCVEKFFSATGWRPRMQALFGGALAYTHYPPWLRWLMRFISGRSGGSVDMTRDHDYTDWTAVERFAREFAVGLREPVTSASRVPAWSPDPVRSA